MPKYSYIAKSLNGEEKSGTAEAKDIRQLARALRGQGFLLIKAEQKGGILKKEGFSFSFPSFGGVPLAEKMFFARNLQVMISAGSPLPKAIGTLAEQVKNKKFRSVLSEIKEDIIKGNSLSGSLAKHGDVFSELFRSMIEVGEEAGNLDEVLKSLSSQMEKENELNSKIKGAMVYPAVIICTMMGIGVLMLVMVVPQLASTFKDLEVELPFTTKIVIGLAGFLIDKWYLVILAIFFIFYIFNQVLKNKSVKKITDNLFLKIPVISPIVKKTNSATVIRSLSSLISAGVPLLRSLEIISGSLGNIYYKIAITETIEKIKKGEKLSEALKPYDNIFPLTVIQMIEVGEETGETANVLSRLAEFFEEEVANSTKNLTSIIEPILMVIIGGVIGFFAISMIQPMYSMLGAIK